MSADRPRTTRDRDVTAMMHVVIGPIVLTPAPIAMSREIPSGVLGLLEGHAAAKRLCCSGLSREMH